MVGVVVVVGRWLLSLLVVAAVAVALLVKTSSPTPNMMQDPSQLDTLVWDVMGPPPLPNAKPGDRRQAAQAGVLD